MKDLSIVDVPRVLKEKLNLLLLSENCWEVLCKKKIIKTFPNNYLSAYNNSAILRFQRAFPVMYKASLSCTVYTWRGRSSSANARILPFRILHFGNEVIFCFIICRAGDSNHSFILLMKIKKSHLIFICPLFSWRLLKEQLLAKSLVKIEVLIYDC